MEKPKTFSRMLPHTPKPLNNFPYQIRDFAERFIAGNGFTEYGNDQMTTKEHTPGILWYFDKILIAKRSNLKLYRPPISKWGTCIYAGKIPIRPGILNRLNAIGTHYGFILWTVQRRTYLRFMDTQQMINWDGSWYSIEHRAYVYDLEIQEQSRIEQQRNQWELDLF